MSWDAWGTPEYLDYPECQTCEGTGEVENDYGRVVRCPDCAGTGLIDPPIICEDDVI